MTSFTWGGDAPATYGGDEPATWGEVYPVPPIEIDAPATLDLSVLDHEVAPSGAAPAIDPDVAPLNFTVGAPWVAQSFSPPVAELDLDAITPAFEASDWIIDGRIVEAIDADLTPQTLTLSFESTRELIDHWRQYDRVGDIQVEIGFGGTFEAVDRAGRDGPIPVRPAIPVQPPFDPAQFYVNSYEETQQAPDRFAITLTLQRARERSETFDAVDEAGGSWTLVLDRGTIALAPEQVRQSQLSGSTAGGTTTLPLALTDEQAAVIADAAAVPDAVVDRQVPDGEDIVEDTSGGRQTVNVDSPDGTAVDDGEYIIQEWTLTRAGAGEVAWLVELTLAK